MRGKAVLGAHYLADGPPHQSRFPYRREIDPEHACFELAEDGLVGLNLGGRACPLGPVARRFRTEPKRIRLVALTLLFLARRLGLAPLPENTREARQEMTCLDKKNIKTS